MIGHRVVRCLTGLGHQVRDVDAGGFGLGDHLRNFLNQKVRQDACVQRARTDQDQMGFAQCPKHFGQRPDAPWHQPHPHDPFARARNIRLARHDRAVLERCLKCDVLYRRWKNSPANSEHLRRYLDRLGEISRAVCEGGEEEIAKTVSAQSSAGWKSVLKQLPEQMLVLRQSHQAIANITRWQNLVFPPQTPGATTVVGDGHDGSEIGNRQLPAAPATLGQVGLQSTQHGRKACASAECNNADGWRPPFDVGLHQKGIRSSYLAPDRAIP